METNHEDDATSLLMARLQETTHICSKALQTDDFEQSEAAVTNFIVFLDSVCETALAEPENAIANRNAFEIISAIHLLVTSPTNQMIVDALSLELPKVVAKFAGLSVKCREVAEAIIDHLCSACNPRDMFSALCGALDFLIKVYEAPNFFIPLLSGISKVFLCIKRHHYEQIKLAVPGILHVLEVVSSESSDEYKDSLRDLIQRVIGISSSIQTVCGKMEGRKKELLRALLGLYVLQVMVLISRTSLADKVSSNIYFMLQLSEFLPFCGLPYLRLISGHDVDSNITIFLGEDDQFKNCFSLAKHGASLAVVWGHISDEVAMAAQEDFGAVKDRLRKFRTERWQALNMLRYMVSAPCYPWELKCHGIDFILVITEGNIFQSFDDDSDWISYMPGLVSLMEAVELVIIYASDAVLRKKAFTSLKSILADIPFSERFVVLKALVSKCTYPSMIALLIDLAKEEIAMRTRRKVSQGDDEKMQIEKNIRSSPFSNSDVLDLVELVLKPQKGGPPTLPEQSDAVLSVLNLYRFLVMLESNGTPTHTGVLSSENLHRAYNEWLLPLRTLVSGTQAENENDNDEFAVDTVCALNPLQLVLYHCLELVEVGMKKTAKTLS